MINPLNFRRTSMEEEMVNIPSEPLVQQKRVKSWIMWSGLASVVVLFGTTIGLWDNIGIKSEDIQNLLNAILLFLSALGVINSPLVANKV
jgi:uncharacterized membrane protein